MNNRACNPLPQRNKKRYRVTARHNPAQRLAVDRYAEAFGYQDFLLPEPFRGPQSS
jgi:hypothetical protein